MAAITAASSNEIPGRALVALAPAHEALAVSALRRGDVDDAIALFDVAAYLRPDVPGFRSGLARALLAAGRPDEAREAAELAVALDRNHAPSHDVLASVAFGTGDGAAAEGALRFGLSLEPENAQRRVNLGALLVGLGRLTEAASELRRAVALDPADARAAETLITCLCERGLFEEADAARRDAPPDARPGPFFSLADPRLAPADVAARYAAAVATLGAPSTEPLLNVPDSDRRLRVGYLSADLREHSTASFLLPLLEHHDRSELEVFAYSNYGAVDGVTQQIRAAVDAFDVVVGLRDDELEARIRRDRIDVLVDPAGWTSGHRLAVFARRPAPITVGMLGQPAAVDACIADALSDPVGTTDALYPFEVVRLPRTYQVYGPPAGAPDVSPLPARTSGHVTFGSFNGLYKMNLAVLEAWAAVLRRVPGSRLLIKCKPLVEQATRERVLAHFGALGVEPARLTLAAFEASRRGHLDRYAEVDLCLDTFPYNGTTTTCEALWMGVPVVALAGRSHIARTGVSVLTNAGLPELVADDVAAYVDLAVELAGDVRRLEALRLGMRERLLASPLLDARTYARDFESAIRGLWQRWCARQRD
jgi:predicted O-linked N-acetylglucosamine transferase (SPINDLY family)